MTTTLTARAPLADSDRAATAAPRLDLYATIHKALRGFMTDALARVARLDVCDEHDMSGTLGYVDELLGFCEKHIDPYRSTP